MTPRRLALLGLNAALLAGLVAVMALDLTSAPDQERRAVSPAAVAAPTAVAVRAPPPPSGRALFRIPTTVLEPQTAGVAPPPPADPTFRLAGVVWSEDQRLAVVQRLDDGAHRRLKLQDAIDGWRLVDLTARAAVFAAGERSVTLRLDARSWNAAP